MQWQKHALGIWEESSLLAGMVGENHHKASTLFYLILSTFQKCRHYDLHLSNEEIEAAEIN